MCNYNTEMLDFVVNIWQKFLQILSLKSCTTSSLSSALVCSYVAEQVLQVVVRRALPLILGQLLHVAVQAEVQSGQLLLHLTHVLQLLEGAHLP